MWVQWTITGLIVALALWLAVRKLAPASCGGEKSQGCGGCANGCANQRAKHRESSPQQGQCLPHGSQPIRFDVQAPKDV